ncbi:MAG: hypothetical protein ABW321_06200, partial [Polyangiales bacterium]
VSWARPAPAPGTQPTRGAPDAPATTMRAPQPSAAAPVAEPRREPASASETSVNAAVALPLPPHRPVDSLLSLALVRVHQIPPPPWRQRPAARAASGNNTSRRPTVYQERRIEADPPPATPDAPTLTAPAPSKRVLTKDWDDRLPLEPPRATATSEVPAGRIDARDFR